MNHLPAPKQERPAGFGDEAQPSSTGTWTGSSSSSSTATTTTTATAAPSDIRTAKEPQTSSEADENEEVKPNAVTSHALQRETKDIGVIIQSLCHLHRWTRTSSDAHVYERPERLRSIRLGLAVARARLLQAYPHERVHGAQRGAASIAAKGKGRQADQQEAGGESQLEDLLDRLSLKANSESQSPSDVSHTIYEGLPFSILSTARRLPLCSPSVSAAVTLAHGEEYARQLGGYIKQVASLQAAHESEVPEGLSQGDLYLCEGSLAAMEGALGACCEAVDQVMAATASSHKQTGAKRFVNIRPPGHHCETDSPMGFCWLNNVAVAAAHAHLEHGINRIVIFDIDLHHGNGTQQIVWRLNALAHQHLQEHQSKKSSPRKGSPRKQDISTSDRQPLQIFYGSLHDINSYPCEELDPTLIAHASLNINGGGGSQFITNVHLETYEDEESFHSSTYPTYRDLLFKGASTFLLKTRADSAKTLTFVSAGFDASEHEYSSMSRHGARVPTSFFRRFASDVSAFADERSAGRLISVLEGGYSQRALSTGVGSFICGLTHSWKDHYELDWWDAKILPKYEKVSQPTSSSKARATNAQNRKDQLSAKDEELLKDIKEILEVLDEHSPDYRPPKPPRVTPPSSVPGSTLRATRSRANLAAAAAASSAHSTPHLRAPNPSVEEALPTRPADSLEATPQPSPLLNRTSAAPPAPSTPLIRFTFKAAQEKQKESHQASSELQGLPSLPSSPFVAPTVSQQPVQRQPPAAGGGPVFGVPSLPGSVVQREGEREKDSVV